MSRPVRIVPLLLAAALAVAGCGGGDDSVEEGAAQGRPASSAPIATGKVSANDASEPEIEAALQAAGVPSAGKWADEIVEYRPYPTDDTDLARLRTKLAKYNPGDEVLAKIVSVLAP